MTIALFKIDHSEHITKSWDVVLYSEKLTIGKCGINVDRICCKKSTLHPFKTTTIVHIDEIDKGVSMITTGPCRYIALNTAIYRSCESSVKVAYSTKTPVNGISLPVNLLDFGNGVPAGFIPTILEIRNCNKLSNDLYSIKTEDKTYFIVVE